MNYEELIETVSLIVENEKIHKIGLTLVYALEPINHRKMHEHLFYKANPTADFLEHVEEFEVTLGGILVKFVKPKSEE